MSVDLGKNSSAMKVANVNSPVSIEFYYSIVHKNATIYYGVVGSLCGFFGVIKTQMKVLEQHLCPINPNPCDLLLWCTALLMCLCSQPGLH